MAEKGKEKGKEVDKCKRKEVSSKGKTSDKDKTRVRSMERDQQGRNRLLASWPYMTSQPIHIEVQIRLTILLLAT